MPLIDVENFDFWFQNTDPRSRTPWSWQCSAISFNSFNRAQTCLLNRSPDLFTKTVWGSVHTFSRWFYRSTPSTTGIWSLFRSTFPSTFSPSCWRPFCAGLSYLKWYKLIQKCSGKSLMIVWLGFTFVQWNVCFFSAVEKLRMCFLPTKNAFLPEKLWISRIWSEVQFLQCNSSSDGFWERSQLLTTRYLLVWHQMCYLRF